MLGLMVMFVTWRRRIWDLANLEDFGVKKQSVLWRLAKMTIQAWPTWSPWLLQAKARFSKPIQVRFTVPFLLLKRTSDSRLTFEKHRYDIHSNIIHHYYLFYWALQLKVSMIFVQSFKVDLWSYGHSWLLFLLQSPKTWLLHLQKENKSIVCSPQRSLCFVSPSPFRQTSCAMPSQSHMAVYF